MSKRTVWPETAVFRRRAEWVWTKAPQPVQSVFTPTDDGCRDDRNRFTYFRRRFSSETAVVFADISISCGGRYQLFVNGELIGRGPGRCHPEFQQVDSFDIKPHLHPGENVIACLVHTYAEDMSWYVRPPMLQRETFGCGGFFVQGDVQGSDSRSGISLDTGTGEWRFLRSDAWNPDTRGIGPGFAEDFSFLAEPCDWKALEIDESTWSVPIIQTAFLRLGGTVYRPFPRMVVPNAAQLTDGEPIRPDVIRFCRVVSQEENPDDFRKECATVPGDDWKQIEQNQQIKSHNGDIAIYLIDFGRTEMGHVFIELDGSAGQKLSYSYSERLTDNGTVYLPKPLPGINEAPIHHITLKDGRQKFEQFDPAGFRYLELHVRLDDRFQLLDSGVVPIGYPVTETGNFNCSDKRLVEVWHASALTLRLCRQDGFIDCPNREQRQWTGDAHVQALFGYMAHSDPRPAERMHRQIAETQRADGMVMMATVCDLAAAGKLYIPDFALWWVLALETHFLYTGRLKELKDVTPAAVRTLQWFVSFIDEDGLLSDVPGWTFIDWSMELDRNGEVTTLNAIFVAAVRGIVTVSRALGLAKLTEELEAVAERVAEAVNRYLYDSSRGLYADARSHGKLSDRFSQQANAAVIAFNIAPENRQSALVERISDDKTLTLTRAWSNDIERRFNPNTQIIMAQPFFSHFVHEAYASAGRSDTILASIRKNWHPMIGRNGTIWEHWQDTPATSLCHAFSATPIYDLPTHIVGIRPTQPGFKEFRIKPCLGDLDWVEATVPTPRGEIYVRWEIKANGNLRLLLSVPENTNAVIMPPHRFQGPTAAAPGKHELYYSPEE